MYMYNCTYNYKYPLCSYVKSQVMNDSNLHVRVHVHAKGYKHIQYMYMPKE